MARRRSRPSPARTARRPIPPPPATAAPAPAPIAGFDVWGSVALAVLTAALYWPVHGFDFINLDDVDYVRMNAHVRAGLTPSSIAWALTTLFAGFWMPLTWLSFLVDATLWGTGAGGYHVTNVLLHVANSVLVAALLHRATGRRWASLTVGALFAVHPLHVESVAWVTERKDVLSTLLSLLGLWAYGVYAARPSAGRYVAALVVFALALMAKPMLVTLPMLLLLLDLWPLGRFRGLPPTWLLWEKVPFALLCVPFMLLTMFAGQHLDPNATFETLPLLHRLANGCEAYALYLVDTVWPVALSVHYPSEPAPPTWRAALVLLGLVAATVAALLAASRRPYVTAGWLWYAIGLVPVSGLVQIGHYARADRFTYVPLLGVFVLVVWTVDGFATTRPRAVAAGTLAAVAVGASTVLAWRQLAYWRDGVALFERTLAVTGPNPTAQYLLGLAYADQGRTDDAMARYEEALRLRPGYVHVHNSLGLILFERGRTAEAMAHYEIALEQAPSDVEVRTNVGNALLLQGKTEEAIAQYAEAVRRDPDVVGARNGWGKALAAEGHVDEAMEQYTTALRLSPDNPEAHNNLANALADRGRVDEALVHFQAALRARPDFVTARVNLALFLAQQGRLAEAEEQFREALRRRPDAARLHGDFAKLLAAAGKLDQARAEFTEVVRLDPTSSAAHADLATALCLLGRVDEGRAEYAEALRLDPSNAEAHANLGLVLAQAGQPRDAIPHYEEAIRVRPTYADAHSRLGSALQAVGDTDGAARHFGEALRLNPDDGVARQALRDLGR